MQKIVVIFLGLLLLGCSPHEFFTPPTDAELNARVGEEPKNHVVAISEYFNSRLKDPESARYSNYSLPKKYWIPDNDIEGFSAVKKINYGWLICVDINAKNSYGGYVGAKRHYLLLMGDYVVFETESPYRDRYPLLAGRAKNEPYDIKC